MLTSLFKYKLPFSDKTLVCLKKRKNFKHMRLKNCNLNNHFRNKSNTLLKKRESIIKKVFLLFVGLLYYQITTKFLFYG